MIADEPAWQALPNAGPAIGRRLAVAAAGAAAAVLGRRRLRQAPIRRGGFRFVVETDVATVLWCTLAPLVVAKPVWRTLGRRGLRALSALSSN